MVSVYQAPGAVTAVYQVTHVYDAVEYDMHVSRLHVHTIDMHSITGVNLAACICGGIPRCAVTDISPVLARARPFLSLVCVLPLRCRSRTRL